MTRDGVFMLFAPYQLGTGHTKYVIIFAHWMPLTRGYFPVVILRIWYEFSKKISIQMIILPTYNQNDGDSHLNGPQLVHYLVKQLLRLTFSL